MGTTTTQQPKRDINTVMADIEKSAAGIQANGNCTKEQAFALALERNPNLYAEYKVLQQQRAFRVKAGVEGL